ncbi:MAG: hypothetical protein HY827_08040 [Actinobacteria bacterium]|nr:hypothetical protein [Actinomycetota bacterium]
MRVRSLLFLVVSLSMLSMGLSGCGSSKEDLEKARQQGAEEYRQKHDAAAQKRKQRELERKIKKLERESKQKSSSRSTSGSGSGGYSSGTSCGGGLSVGPNTTCSFAENVRSEWYSAGSGDVLIDVYSPVTGSTYTMSCNAGTTTVCRGGNNATVYIR